MATVAPSRSLEQRRNALERANELRTARADLKRYIRTLTYWDGRLYVADLVDDCPDWLRSMRLMELMTAVNRMGCKQARKLMNRADPRFPMDTDHRLGDLTDRRRAGLAGVLRKDGR